MRACHQADVPCHRIIAAGGTLGGYGGNLSLKRALLRAEGIPVTGDHVRNWAAYRWLAHEGTGQAGQRRRNIGRRENVSR
jgi:alkylated DNA nucleotide flippase Atl1